MMYAMHISDIEKAKEYRPKEYIDALYKVGVIQGNSLIIRSSDLKRIWEEFQPERVDFITANRKDPNCCGKTNHNVSGSVPPKQYPSILTMAKNLAGSAGRAAKAVVSGDKLLRTDEEKQKCLDICQTNKCGFYDAEKARCIKCGCFSKFKTRLANEHCPLPVRLW